LYHGWTGEKSVTIQGVLRFLCVLVVMAVSSVAGADNVKVTPTAIVLDRPIYFESGKGDIKKESLPLLDAVAAALAKDRKIALLEIAVHSDERGDDQWNLKLTQQRAEAVRDYLVGKGIDAGRLRATGYGESKPIDKGHNEKAWAKNRRTELVILQRMT